MTARPLRAASRPAPIRVIHGQGARRPRIAGWVVYTTVVALAFFGLIYSQTSLDASAFELKEIEAQIAVEETRYQELRLEVARLQSPARVAPAAESMGMVLPTALHTVTVPGVVAAEDEPVTPTDLLTAAP